VIGIIGYLIALLAPAATAARQAAQRTQCSAQLRQIGYAVQSYANDNRGWIPRDCTLGRPDRQPWMIQLAKYLRSGSVRADLTADDLPSFQLLRCPTHPLDGIPTCYVVNAFAFESAPNWSPDGPVKLTRVSRQPELPWVLESATEYFTPAPPPETRDGVWFVQYHDAYAPAHLPDGERHRISDDRHFRRTANVLYLDAHVATIHRGDLKLEQFDDGLRKRATPPPTTGN